MSARRRILLLAALLAPLAFGSPARASDDATTERLRRAYELRREHRNEEALAVYDEAFALSPTPAVRAQRALAEQALGRWVVAERELDIALASDDPWVERNRPSLEEARAFVGQHLAWLQVDVEAPGAEARLDGAPFPLGEPVRVAAGALDLEVRAPGRTPDVRSVAVLANAHVHEVIALAAIPTQAASEPAVIPAPPARAPAPEAPAAARRFPALPIALGAAGIAGIATGAYFGIRSGNALDREHAHCAGGCVPAAADDYAEARSTATISTIAFGAGIASLGAGVALWLLDRPSTPPAARTLDVSPVLGAGMNGLVLRGRM